MPIHLRRLMLWGGAFLGLATAISAAGESRERMSRPWAFEPIPTVEPPADPSGWSANALDCFIRAKQWERGLRPVGPADKRTLIRRATFDLTGLPPTTEEIDAFRADSSADAWKRAIDRLLSSPRYGERWGRHWLDVVRYADTGGFELAKWLTSPRNPLTARVLVNRVWGWHFGQAIVRTPSDFGAQGEPPTHPELLDWLARDFIEHGWSLKHLHRLILLSSTYRLGSVAEKSGLAIDPDNRLLWHSPRRRLEGEAIRDSLLACSGTLNLKPYGPAVVPPLGNQELAGLFDARGKWPVTKDASEHTRRSVYLLVRRTFLYPLLASFDPPEVMTSCSRRMQTVVPVQALTLLNSPLAREQSAAFARRLLRDSGEEPVNQVARAWRLAFGRPSTPTETARALAFLRKRAASSSEEAALAELCLALFNANEFVYLD